MRISDWSSDVCSSDLAKAVLCPGLTVRLLDDASGEKNEWRYEDGLSDYLRGELVDRELLPPQLFIGSQKKDNEVVDWAAAWVPDGDLVQESYVNLIPTAQHGTHVNGLRPDRKSTRLTPSHYCASRMPHHA